MPEYNETNPLTEEITNPILKSFLKYDKYPIVTAIINLNIKSHFEFFLSALTRFFKKLRNLILSNTAQKMKFSIKDFFSKCDQIPAVSENFIFCAAKAAQSTVVSVKMLKDNADIFAVWIFP